MIISLIQPRRECISSLSPVACGGGTRGTCTRENETFSMDRTNGATMNSDKRHFHVSTSPYTSVGARRKVTPCASSSCLKNHLNSQDSVAASFLSVSPSTIASTPSTMSFPSTTATSISCHTAFSSPGQGTPVADTAKATNSAEIRSSSASSLGLVHIHSGQSCRGSNVGSRSPSLSSPASPALHRVRADGVRGTPSSLGGGDGDPFTDVSCAHTPQQLFSYTPSQVAKNESLSTTRVDDDAAEVLYFSVSPPPSRFRSPVRSSALTRMNSTTEDSPPPSYPWADIPRKNKGGDSCNSTARGRTALIPGRELNVFESRSGPDPRVSSFSNSGGVVQPTRKNECSALSPCLCSPLNRALDRSEFPRSRDEQYFSTNLGSSNVNPCKDSGGEPVSLSDNHDPSSHRASSSVERNSLEQGLGKKDISSSSSTPSSPSFSVAECSPGGIESTVDSSSSTSARSSPYRRSLNGGGGVGCCLPLSPSCSENRESSRSSGSPQRSLEPNYTRSVSCGLSSPSQIALRKGNFPIPSPVIPHPLTAATGAVTNTRKTLPLLADAERRAQCSPERSNFSTCSCRVSTASSSSTWARAGGILAERDFDEELFPGSSPTNAGYDDNEGRKDHSGKGGSNVVPLQQDLSDSQKSLLSKQTRVVASSPAPSSFSSCSPSALCLTKTMSSLLSLRSASPSSIPCCSPTSEKKHKGEREEETAAAGTQAKEPAESPWSCLARESNRPFAPVIGNYIEGFTSSSSGSSTSLSPSPSPRYRRRYFHRGFSPPYEGSPRTSRGRDSFLSDESPQRDFYDVCETSNFHLEEEVGDDGIDDHGRSLFAYCSPAGAGATRKLRLTGEENQKRRKKAKKKKRAFPRRGEGAQQQEAEVGKVSGGVGELYIHGGCSPSDTGDVDVDEERSDEEEGKEDLEKDAVRLRGQLSCGGRKSSSGLPSRSRKGKGDVKRGHNSLSTKGRGIYTGEKKQGISRVSQSSHEQRASQSVLTSLREDGDAEDLFCDRLPSPSGAINKRDKPRTDNIKMSDDGSGSCGVGRGGLVETFHSSLKNPKMMVERRTDDGDGAVASSSLIEATVEERYSLGEGGYNSSTSENRDMQRKGYLQKKDASSLCSEEEAQQGCDDRSRPASSGTLFGVSPSEACRSFVDPCPMSLSASGVRKNRSSKKHSMKHSGMEKVADNEDWGQVPEGNSKREKIIGGDSNREQGPHKEEVEEEEDLDSDDDNYYSEEEDSSRRSRPFVHRGRSRIRETRTREKGGGKRGESVRASYDDRWSRYETDLLSAGGARGAVTGLQLLTEGTLLGGLLFGIGGEEKYFRNRRRRDRQRNRRHRSRGLDSDDENAESAVVLSSSSTTFSDGGTPHHVRDRGRRRERRTEASSSNPTSTVGTAKSLSPRVAKEGEGQEAISGDTTESQPSGSIRRLEEEGKERRQRGDACQDENEESLPLISSGGTASDGVEEKEREDNGEGKRSPRRHDICHKREGVAGEEKRVSQEGRVPVGGEGGSAQVLVGGDSATFSFGWFRQLTEQLSNAAFPSAYTWDGAQQFSASQSRGSSLSSSGSSSRPLTRDVSSRSSGSEVNGVESDDRSSEDEDEEARCEAYEMSSRTFAELHHHHHPPSQDITSCPEKRQGRFSHDINNKGDNSKGNEDQRREGRGSEDAQDRAASREGDEQSLQGDTAHPSSSLWTTTGWYEGRRRGKGGKSGGAEGRSRLLPYAIVEEEEEKDYESEDADRKESEDRCVPASLSKHQRRVVHHGSVDDNEARIMRENKVEGERDRQHEEITRPATPSQSLSSSSVQQHPFGGAQSLVSAVALSPSCATLERVVTQLSPSEDTSPPEERCQQEKYLEGEGKTPLLSSCPSPSQCTEFWSASSVLQREIDSTAKELTRGDGIFCKDSEDERGIRPSSAQKASDGPVPKRDMLCPRSSVENSVERIVLGKTEGKKVHPNQFYRRPCDRVGSSHSFSSARSPTVMTVEEKTQRPRRRSDDADGQDKEGSERHAGGGMSAASSNLRGEEFFTKGIARERGHHVLDRAGHKNGDDGDDEWNGQSRKGTRMLTVVQPHHEQEDEDTSSKAGVFSSFASLTTWLSPENVFHKGTRQSPSWMGMEAMGEQQGSDHYHATPSWEGEGNDDKRALSSSLRERRKPEPQALTYMNVRRERVTEQETQGDADEQDGGKREHVSNADSSSRRLGAFASFSSLYSLWGGRLA
ncbi:hypothetical protein CSUI_004294 [Cystoisospora suis]|uniref:Uncharacterized protein n=1 Tax=Cystoisospora suis TaxID=483139 RepID=A0A2C6KXT1_9APIC|nr:hypothetical protein CSUI_004294 [Cystoisospora suis]